MISERLLRKWRVEALRLHSDLSTREDTKHDAMKYAAYVQSGRVLELTQELLDQHLLRRKS